MRDDGDVTRLLQDMSDGSEEAAERLYPRVYAELKSIAAARLRAERAGHTLSATALVHEAYLKLVRQSDVDWQSRGHFFSIAARAMRRVLLDYAIARKAEKRGGGAALVTLEHESAGRDVDLDQVIAIDEALTRLAELDARQAQVVELRYFGGLNLEDIATALEVSLSSVNRDWRMARAFLANTLS
ncbi:MAG: sigma-70 family RNA polymerase sigma factor [Gemmatimonadetes bacterium]|nr:sigma-70 family RNA polymerase sigma factor [Gemmatimonadota bacterium]